MRKRLFGGRKTRKVKLKKGKRLGGRYEGVVRSVEVEIKRGKRKKTVKLAEKRFKLMPASRLLAPNLRKPAIQFKIIQELSNLNKEKELGLRIVPTIRLRKTIFWRKRLLSTMLKEKTELTEKEKQEFFDDMLKQNKIAAKNGFWITFDAFLPIEEKGKILAVIADFGGIERIPKQNH